MITGTITHPEILSQLARAGHGSIVLVCDGHYAAATRVGANARTVFLNLRAGAPTVPDVTSALLESICVEHVTQMQPAADAMPSEVQEEIAQLTSGVPRTLVSREQFYALATSADVALVVVTGDTRRFGNVALRVGVLVADR
jgi:L-fucose mutarotase